MQFNRNGKVLSSTGKLDDHLYEIKSVSDFCKLINNKGIMSKLNNQDRPFMGSLINFFKETNMIYKHYHKYHVKGTDEPLDVFFKKSNSRLDKERKQAQANFQIIPSYSQYVPAYHEDYVYSDANWDPSLASL